MADEDTKVIARCKECGLRYRGATVGNVSDEKKARHEAGLSHRCKTGQVRAY